jgi:hypothetical protein
LAFCRCRCPALARGFRGQRQTEDTAPHRIARACRRVARGIGPPWNHAARLRRLNPSARNSWGIAVEVERFVVKASRAWAATARSRRQTSRAMHKRSILSVLSACELNHDRKHRFQPFSGSNAATEWVRASKQKPRRTGSARRGPWRCWRCGTTSRVMAAHEFVRSVTGTPVIHRLVKVPIQSNYQGTRTIRARAKVLSTCHLLLGRCRQLRPQFS